jgi:hypothetical protein
MISACACISPLPARAGRNASLLHSPTKLSRNLLRRLLYGISSFLN